MSVDLSVNIGGGSRSRIPSSRPAAASATASSTPASLISELSARSAVKGLFSTSGRDTPRKRIVETPSGMLNAIGLQGIGGAALRAEKLPRLRDCGAVVIVNICGSSIEEYAEVARILDGTEGVAAIELNISCPNIEKGGMMFGSSLRGTHDVVAAVRRVTRLPLIPS